MAHRSSSGTGEDLRARLPTPVFRPGEFHGLYSPWDRKESNITEQHMYVCMYK